MAWNQANLRVRNSVQSPGLFGFRFIMVMSYIVLKVDSVESNVVHMRIGTWFTSAQVDRLIQLADQDGFE